MTGIAGPCSRHSSILYVDGPLRLPIQRRLRDDVRALLHTGERCIVVDLARVSSIDAAGVGELVRAYNMASAVNGFLRIAHPSGWVREILERVGLAGLLTAEEEVA